MPLNEREQQILEEIERQFRVEDPKFTRKTSLSRLTQRNLHLAVAGAAVGLLTLLVTFSFNTVLALGGFGLMVLSVSAVIRIRGGSSKVSGRSSRDYLSSARNSRWPFRR